MKITSGIGRFGDPFLDEKNDFFDKNIKSGHGILPGGKGAKITLDDV